MAKVWKYALDPREIKTDDHVFKVWIPDGARFLHLAEQAQQVTLWYEIPDDHEDRQVEVEHKFHLVGTGHPFDSGESMYLGTTLHLGGRLVLHTYEKMI
jgi:hypothetical protein